MTPLSAAEDAGALWLATLQRALGRASHDVKDSLNGVSVNLEVIRSRAAKPDAPAASVAQFADAAGQQLERLTTLVEAVLALGRAEREPTDVGVVLRRIATLCSASSSSADATIRVDWSEREAALTRVRGDAVRLAMAAPLLDLVSAAKGERLDVAARCVVSTDARTITVTISAAGRQAAMPEAVAETLRASGVRWTAGEHDGVEDLSLVFPRA